MDSVSVPHFVQGWCLALSPTSAEPLPNFRLVSTPLPPTVAFKATSPNYTAVTYMRSSQISSSSIALSIKLNSGSLNKPLCLRVNERPEQTCTRFHLRNFWCGGVLIIRKYCPVGASLDCSSSSLCYSTEPQSPLLVFWAEDQHLKCCYRLGLRLARHTAAAHTFRHTPVWLQGRERDSLTVCWRGRKNTWQSPPHMAVLLQCPKEITAMPWVEHRGVATFCF